MKRFTVVNEGYNMEEVNRYGRTDRYTGRSSGCSKR